MENKQRKIFTSIILTWSDAKSGSIFREQKKIRRIKYSSYNFTIKDFNDWYEEEEIHYRNSYSKNIKKFQNANFRVEVFFEAEDYGLKQYKYNWFLRPEYCKSFEDFKNYGEVIQSFYDSLLTLYNKEQGE